MSVVIGRFWSSRAQDDRPTLRRNCGAVGRQACSLPGRRDTRRRCTRHPDRVAALGGFWRLFARLSSDDGHGRSVAIQPTAAFGWEVLRCYTPPPSRRAFAGAHFMLPHSRFLRGKKGSHLEGRAYSTGPEARSPGAPPPRRQPTCAQRGQDAGPERHAIALGRAEGDGTPAITAAISALDRAAEKGIIHRNNAARRKSRLMAKANAAHLLDGTQAEAGPRSDPPPPRRRSARRSPPPRRRRPPALGPPIGRAPPPARLRSPSRALARVRRRPPAQADRRPRANLRES